MAKYGQATRAYELFEEALQKGFKLNTETYNLIILSAMTLRENNQKRLDFVLTTLNKLNENDLKPNIRTLNATAEVLSLCKNDRLCKAHFLKIINEFKLLGVEPSLATYYFLLITFYREGTFCILSIEN